eukprot:TRINITY_DN384_c0_g3_i2.p1 TRINITY_DN384_c0_g3~~TRINITY_DN384_c0_g3_i2.p1  ORF type:complete len:248 (+),score=36.17 TRINITY_DN384_c0_g3_i2:504-1247(+)
MRQYRSITGNLQRMRVTQLSRSLCSPCAASATPALGHMEEIRFTTRHDTTPQIKAGLEDFLLTSGVSFGEFFAELVKKKQAQLTPQEVVSDLNMRYVMYDIAQQPVPGTTLLVVPATEYHAAVGWAAAAKWLTPTSVNEALDANLDLVPSFSKATKRPEFLEVERAVHVDTPTHVAPQGDELALTQDPRLARAVGVHNPMLHETLRPSPAIRVLSPLRDGGKGAVFQYEQTTSDGRAAIAQNPDNIL